MTPPGLEIPAGQEIPGGLEIREKSGQKRSPLSCPRIYLHIGEPKTGTTFLQDAMWHNRSRMAAQGVLLPGYSHQDHARASRDLRGAPRAARDPAAPWIGDWDVLARQARHAPETAVISNELLAACDARQASQAVRSLLPAEVHIILTVRDFATLLPAEWQERIKCRDTVQWEEWLDRVVGAEPDAGRRHRSWFWNVHDTLAILDAWSQHLPPDHVHVVTIPQHARADLLWERFMTALGLDPGGADLAPARSNASLGIPETEFLRRMNEALPADVPDWFYTRNIKRVLAHEVLAGQPGQPRLALPVSRQAWAREQAETLVAGLRDAKYHVVGDPDDLLPPRLTGHRTGPAGHHADPASWSAELLLDTAVRAAAAFADRQYRQLRPAPRPRPRLGAPRQLAVRLVWRTLNGRRLTRALRQASHRPAVRRLRVAIWCALTHPARHHT